MTDLADFELRRARWRRAVQAEGLDTVDQGDIALRGLAARRRTPSVRLLLLPGDPEGEAIAIDDEFGRGSRTSRWYRSMAGTFASVRKRSRRRMRRLS